MATLNAGVLVLPWGKSDVLILPDPLPFFNCCYYTFHGLHMNGVQDIRQESVIIGATTAFSGKAHLSWMLSKDIQSNVTNNSQVFSRMIFAHSVVIFMKGHVKTPVKRTFNSPMGSGCFRKSVHIG